MTGAAIGKFQADLDYTVKSVSPKQTIVEMKALHDGARSEEGEGRQDPGVSGSMALTPPPASSPRAKPTRRWRCRSRPRASPSTATPDTQVKITRAN